MKIALDLDDALVDTCAVLLDWIEASLGYRIDATRLANYQLGADPSQMVKIVAAFHADQADKKIRALDGAAEACRRLGDNGFELVIVTSRPPELAAQTRDLVDRLFPAIFAEIHTVGIEPDKAATLLAIGADLLIDDNFRHIQGAAAGGLPAILFRDLPWNRQIPWPHRAYSWPDAVTMAGRLLHGGATLAARLDPQGDGR